MHIQFPQQMPEKTYFYDCSGADPAHKQMTANTIMNSQLPIMTGTLYEFVPSPIEDKSLTTPENTPPQAARQKPHIHAPTTKKKKKKK